MYYFVITQLIKKYLVAFKTSRVKDNLFCSVLKYIYGRCHMMDTCMYILRYAKLSIWKLYHQQPNVDNPCIGVRNHPATRSTNTFYISATNGAVNGNSGRNNSHLRFPRSQRARFTVFVRGPDVASSLIHRRQWRYHWRQALM